MDNVKHFIAYPIVAFLSIVAFIWLVKMVNHDTEFYGEGWGYLVYDQVCVIETRPEETELQWHDRFDVCIKAAREAQK